MRRIYAQGDLDGACFLYSIVNAYAALRHEGPDFAAVSRAFAQVDHPADFLSGIVGTTGRYDLQYDLLEDNIRRVLALLGGGTFTVRRIARAYQVDLLEELLGENSVVVLRYMGSSKYLSDMDHWVCAVDYEPGGRTVHVACSTRLQRACTGEACTYAETFNERSGCWSNDMLLPGREHTLVDGEAFQITWQP
ncbi:MAG: hypothetical protein KKF77_02575 [Proteobacteria bacterium]|nr:hypothetical protein [Pseudomonadota bacterium]